MTVIDIDAMKEQDLSPSLLIDISNLLMEYSEEQLLRGLQCVLERMARSEEAPDREKRGFIADAIEDIVISVSPVLPPTIISHRNHCFPDIDFETVFNSLPLAQ